ncbi:GspH/FimT family pseudopilin [Parendozoicomonas sp. Alg238-R29]|uniref:GspH/FimT family pseudopilin n=1 Tax=Parendozoicomonas sp. Alg238-R29 TaxID=2993446 RepID=UPI00248EC615|nr:GspH/FimT family pseudopilin [Parendozoicomonas sp. Alg238-R29]
MHNKRKKTNNGFTLVELMVIVAIISILATVAVPGFNDFIQRNSVASEANRLISILRYARSEAVQLQRDIRVCQANATQDDCGTGNNGFLVIDAFNSKVLQATPPFSGDLVISNVNITFSEDGSTGNAGAITVRDGKNKNSADIQLNVAGLVTL